MNRRRLTTISVIVLCGIALCMSLPARKVSAQKAGAQSGSDQNQQGGPNDGSIYDPYPPGILPPDLDPEIERVLREIRVVEKRALDRWAALTPPTLTGQPPILQGTGTEAVETLGELMNYDQNISPNRNVACSSCHMPYVAFGPPIPSVNLTMIAYPGTVHFRAGKRNPQRYTYAPFFPVLQFNEEQALFFGGNFWDSRATGYLLRNPDAHQAQGPPVDTQEMGFPDTACITFRLSQAKYRPLFEQVFGEGSFDIKFPHDTEEICRTPGGAAVFGGSATPVHLSPEDRTKSNQVYDHWGQSVDAYEQSVRVSAFSSKFDAFLKHNYTLTADEKAGYDLFRGKGNCNSCHLDGRSTAPTPTAPTSEDTGVAALVTPLFTCFGSANEGLPLNPRNAFYYQTTPDHFGFTGNPYGFAYRDVAMTPPQCPTTEAPGPYFQKEFFHNGYIKSLKQLVHFYNTRDKKGYAYPVTSGHCPAGTTEKVDCWPMPEVKNNLDMTTGDLHLTDQEEDQIVAFLQTLTDGYTRPYPNQDVYMGRCMTGGTAATQGNEFLIPTPPLPPCASVICDVPPLPTMPIP